MGKDVSQGLVAAALALTTFLRKGVGNEADLYQEFFRSLEGIEMVEKEFRGIGVQVEGLISLPTALEMGKPEGLENTRMISFYFKDSDLALLNEATARGSAPLFQGTWRQVLERLIVEYQRVHMKQMNVEEQLSLSSLLRAIYS